MKQAYSELHIQPLPHFNNSTCFIIQRSKVLCNFNNFNRLNSVLNPICHLLALLGAHHILHISRIRVNPSNSELNPICHLLALLGAHHILHIIRIRVNPSNSELNPICHLLALLGAHHIFHISRIRVNPSNSELNPICHLLALLGAHHILHVSRIRVNYVIYSCLKQTLHSSERKEDQFIECL